MLGVPVAGVHAPVRAERDVGRGRVRARRERDPASDQAWPPGLPDEQARVEPVAQPDRAVLADGEGLRAERAALGLEADVLGAGVRHDDAAAARVAEAVRAQRHDERLAQLPGSERRRAACRQRRRAPSAGHGEGVEELLPAEEASRHDGMQAHRLALRERQRQPAKAPVEVAAHVRGPARRRDPRGVDDDAEIDLLPRDEQVLDHGVLAQRERPCRGSRGAGQERAAADQDEPTGPILHRCTSCVRTAVRGCRPVRRSASGSAPGRSARMCANCGPVSVPSSRGPSRTARPCTRARPGRAGTRPRPPPPRARSAA